MELTKSFNGGLNTDDAFEVISPEDYHVAENVMSGRATKGKNGLLQSVRGTRELVSTLDIPLNNGDFEDGLTGWTQKIIAQISGSASMSLSVPNATMIAGTIGALSGSASIELTSTGTISESLGYDVTIFARSESMSSAQAAKVMYSINGGTPVQLGTSFTVTTSYATIGTISNVLNLSDLEVGAQQNSTGFDVVFGASGATSGFYSGFLGLFDPYFVVVENNISIYLRIDLDESGFFREA